MKLFQTAVKIKIYMLKINIKETTVTSNTDKTL